MMSGSAAISRTTRLERWLFCSTLALCLALAGERSARAQDIEVPVLVIEENNPDEPEGTDEELDLANLVTSAAKGVSTVQEAPAIVTIIPEDELRQSHARTLGEVIDRIPGFLRFEAFNGQFPQALSRGVMQAVLQLHDGFSMFDPMANSPPIHRGLPLEMVKRIETISGPGGVLWGANSFLGVVNVITKDAEDIDGVEANFSYADGKGDRSAARAYVLAGIPELFGQEGWGLVLHTSFESYRGPIYTRAAHMYSTPLPNPNSVFFYGPIRDTDPRRSWILNFDGKLALGALTLQWAIPFQQRYFGMGFAGNFAVQDLAEDDLPECMGADPESITDRCYDPARAARISRINFLDRYGLAEYKARFSDTAGVSVKGYFIQFVRNFDPLLVLMPLPGILEGGLAFTARSTIYRAGSSVDGHAEISETFRLLYGVEAFHEWVEDSTDGSRGGAGIESTFLSPYALSRLPFACPRTGTWNATSQEPDVTGFVPGCPVTVVYEVSRTTLGGFTSAQLRPTPRLILDAGVRLQIAPELDASSRGYGLAPTFSAAAVYELFTNWHMKLNYAEGFRAPVFNNTDSNGEAVNIGGSPDLELERSRSAQGEINARLFKGRRRIRELDLRVDYSYTTLTNYISFIAGRYANTGERGIHSGELLAKLYIKGGHRFELGYTYNRIEMSDKGAFHAMPNNWLNVAMINQLVPGRMELSTVLRVYGAFEDPNRRVEARDLMVDPLTGNANPDDASQAVQVQAYETVIDRIPPSAEIQVGLRWRSASGKVQLQGTVYNAFNNERYSYDNANDLEPRLEILPSNFEGFRAYGSATFAF